MTLEDHPDRQSKSQQQQQNHHQQQHQHAAGNKRRRARKACIPCRTRKRKCDATSPCEMCVTYGYTCLYDEDDSPLAPFVAQNGGGGGKRARMSVDESADSPSSTRHDASHADSPNTPSSSAAARRRNKSPTPPYEGGMLDEAKTRYVGLSSAFAFPRVLGLELKSKNPPPLHSFGYNFGIRPEEISSISGDITELVTEEDLNIFSNVFFSALAPIIDLLDQRIYSQRCHDYYKGATKKDVVFSAVAAGVVAFGSFLSTNQGHPKELEIVQYAKMVLEDPASTRRPCVDQVVGWSLRTIYLRATTRPNNSWLASCTMMHLAEALGLHEEENIKKLAASPSALSIGHDPERLRRIFWISWSCHVITSHEYGRSPVRFPVVTCENISPSIGTYSHLQVRLAQTIPSVNSPFQLDREPEDLRDSIFQRIKACYEVPTGHPFVALTRADLIFCFYRRLRQRRINVTHEVIEQIIAAGNDAVEASIQLVKDSRPFWNILGSVFQFACVLLAIDTPNSLANVKSAFRGLETIVRAADTRLTREALTTARLLLKDTINKKKQELADLEEADVADSQQPSSDAQAELPPDLDLNLNWDQFFDEPFQALLGNPELLSYAPWTNGVH